MSRPKRGVPYQDGGQGQPREDRNLQVSVAGVPDPRDLQDLEGSEDIRHGCLEPGAEASEGGEGGGCC